MKVGAIYGTFYDLDMLEGSILSIKGAVEYVVVVHQRIGFNGKAEENGNQEILDDLVNKGLIDEVVYYESAWKTKAVGMLEKLNIGLIKCREQKCDYVIGMSCDERYDSGELLKDIAEMQGKGIDTCYYPIRAYYYDTNHYFIDTYYTQTIHKVDDRIYEISKSSLLCDPLKKMREGKYMVSQYFMEHYTFLKDKYGNKLNNSIRCIDNQRIKDQMQIIYDRLMQWEDGKTATVFSNDLTANGRVILKEVQLSKKRNSVAVCIPFYRREDITSFVFDYYQKQKKRLQDYIDIVLIACGSEKNKSRQMALKYGFEYTEYANSPLAQKHNAVFKKAKDYNVDACIKIDSDSIVSDEFFIWYNKLINEKVDYAGVTDIYFAVKDYLCYTVGYKYKRKNEPTGVGRFMSRRLMDLLDWNLWGDSDREYGFDKIMTLNIDKLPGIKKEIIKCQDVNGYIIDIKSIEQLTPLSDFEFDAIIPINSFDIDFTPIKEAIYDIPIEQIHAIDKSFTVVIPTMWQSEYLKEMLDVYCDNEKVKQIIIIDNLNSKSFDIKSSKVLLLKQKENIFVNPAWNLGVSKATTENIIIANDDILIDKQDFNKLIELLQEKLKWDMVIGVSESCFKNPTSTIQIQQMPNKSIADRNKGYGVFMAIKKYSYVTINENIKIWYGDDIQFLRNSAYKIDGLHIETKMSRTVNSFGLREKAKQDMSLFDVYYDKNGNEKLPEAIKRNTKNKTMITFNMATYPARANIFMNAVNSVLPYADKVRIYLNEYTEVPKFLNHPKIEAYLGSNIKDTGKFFWAGEKRDEIYFTIDDDFIYTREYIMNTLNFIQKESASIVTIHARQMESRPKRITHAKEYYFFYKELKEAKQANYAGTALCSLDLNKIQIPIEAFLEHGKADEYFALYCLRNKIKIICRPHTRKEVRRIETKSGLWGRNKIAGNNNYFLENFVY